MHGLVARGDGGGGGGVGLVQAVEHEDLLLQFPAGVGKQLCPTVSHINFGRGVGGGVGAGQVKHDALDSLELALHSTRPVDQPFTGRLSGAGWLGKR